MVRKNQILLKDLRGKFLSKKQIDDFISRKDIKLRSRTKEDVLAEILEKKTEEDEERTNQLRVNRPLIPENHLILSRVSNSIFANIVNNARFLIYWKKNNMFSEELKKILSSDELANLTSKYRKNFYIAKTKGQADRIKQDLVERVNDYLSDDLELDSKQKNPINFITEKIENDIHFGKKYRVGRSNKELTFKFWNDYCTEATLPRKYNYRDRTNVTCVVKCILNLNTKFFMKRKADNLISYSKTLVDKNNELSVDDIKIIAEKFEIDIYILDVEGDVWWNFEYSQKEKNTTTYVMIYKKHAKIVKEKWRRVLAASSNKNIRLQNKSNLILPIPESDDEIRPDIIKDITLSRLNLLTENTICYMQDMLKAYKYLSDNNYDFEFTGWSQSILSLCFKNNHRKKIEIRNIGLLHKLMNYTPMKYNLTFGGATMYLFRRFMTNTLIKPSDPVISQVFKNMCKPTIYMKPCNITKEENKKIYIIDLSKAYRYSCKNLGSFRNVPRLKFANIKNIKLKEFYTITGEHKGVYECTFTNTEKNPTWLCQEQIIHLIKKQNIVNIRYYILFDETTNLIDDFATHVYSNEFYSTSTKKNMINVLIGKLNPRVEDIRENAIYNDKKYLDEMLSKNNKDLYYYSILPDGRYYIEFNFKNESKQLSGYNAAYLPAQIIQRCKHKVKLMSEYLRSNYNAEIIGSMTDSVIFATETIEIQEILSEYNKLHGTTWNLELEGDSIITRGVGQYCVMKDGYPVRTRHQGVQPKDIEKILKTDIQPKKNTPLYTVLKLENKQKVTIIDGKPGCGKSYYINNSYDNHAIKTAYTRTAASNINGITISSLFNLGEKGEKNIEESLMRMSFDKKLKLQTATVLIIDEYCVLPYNIWQRANEVMRFVRNDYRIMGGIDLVFAGDVNQLQAIGPSFIQSSAFTKLKRKANHIFLGWHEKARMTQSYFNWCEKYTRDLPPDKYIKLFANRKLAKKPVDGYYLYYTNKRVARRNLAKLGIKVKKIDKFTDVEYIKKNLGLLKKNTPIMITRNTKQFNNGDTFCIESVSDITKATIVGKRGKYICDLNDIDFRLAYAMTVHKAQSETYKGINIILTKKELSLPNIRHLIYAALTRVRDFCNCYVRILN